ncbi:MAG: NADH:flavin oxidoreductase/NADH oxidase family protein [Acidobacteriaceae bacterium]
MAQANSSSNVLSEPLKLPCGAVLTNRLAKASMTEGLGDSMNRATERHVRAYRRWAQGGAGLLLTGNVQVDRTHLDRAGNIAIDGNGGLESLRAMARAGTSAGNHLWMQINHPGRQTPAGINPRPLAPSAIPLAAVEQGCGSPVAMTEAQILDVVRRFAHVATVARETGFTGVQIHAAHGYLLSEFLSPLSNSRTDGWGGSLENRARLLMEIVAAVRKAVGADYPVAVKLNSSDFQKSGFSDDESMRVVQWLSGASLDLLEISGGNYEQPQMIGRGESQLAEASVTGAVYESTRLREAYFLGYAKRIRPTSDLPLMITGGFRSAAGMKAALDSDVLDIIGLARPLCADLDVCAKLLAGTMDEIMSPERMLKLDRATLGPELSDVELKMMQSYGPVAWCYLQILRLGEGQEPDLALNALQALAGYDASERAAIAALRRN